MGKPKLKLGDLEGMSKGQLTKLRVELLRQQEALRGTIATQQGAVRAAFVEHYSYDQERFLEAAHKVDGQWGEEQRRYLMGQILQGKHRTIYGIKITKPMQAKMAEAGVEREDYEEVAQVVALAKKNGMDIGYDEAGSIVEQLRNLEDRLDSVEDVLSDQGVGIIGKNAEAKYFLWALGAAAQAPFLDGKGRAKFPKSKDFAEAFLAKEGESSFTYPLDAFGIASETYTKEKSVAEWLENQGIEGDAKEKLAKRVTRAYSAYRSFFRSIESAVSFSKQADTDSQEKIAREQLATWFNEFLKKDGTLDENKLAARVHRQGFEPSKFEARNSLEDYDTSNKRIELAGSVAKLREIRHTLAAIDRQLAK